MAADESAAVVRGTPSADRDQCHSRPLRHEHSAAQTPAVVAGPRNSWTWTSRPWQLPGRPQAVRTVPAAAGKAALSCGTGGAAMLRGAALPHHQPKVSDTAMLLGAVEAVCSQLPPPPPPAALSVSPAAAGLYLSMGPAAVMALAHSKCALCHCINLQDGCTLICSREPPSTAYRVAQLPSLHWAGAWSGVAAPRLPGCSARLEVPRCLWLPASAWPWSTKTVR